VIHVALKVNKMKSTLSFALVAPLMTFATTFALAGDTATPHIIGPFSPAPALALYIVGDGKPLTAHLSITQGARSDGDRIMIRAFDPDQHLTLWKYIEPGQKPTLNTRGDGESAFPAPEARRDGASLTWFETDMPLGKAGAYQIRVTSGTANTHVTVTLSRPAGYGVSFQNGDYLPWPNQPSRLYAFIPPHAEELNLSFGPVRVTNENGIETINLTGADPSKPAMAPIAGTGVVWAFDFPNVINWKLRAWGFPVILRPTPEAARAIHASVETLPDGTVVTWKFQARIAELLPKMLDPAIIGTADRLVVPLASRKAEWLKDPVRNQNVLSPYCAYSAVEEALRNQNIDPTSHWSGATGSVVGGGTGGWIDFEKLMSPLNRWDRLKTIDGLQSGASPRSLDAEGLAFAATLDEPFNPYYGSKALLYRAAAAALRDLMTLGEDEVWRGESSDNDAYPGFMAFALGQKTLPTYAMVAPLMPPDIRAVWTEGMRHLIDRSYPDGLVSCRNQSSHYLVVYQQFAEGSGDPQYKEMAHAYAERFIQGLSPAGYAMEQMGPDGTYNGMTHWHMALYYRETGDPAMAEALRKSYQFFNHTVAPEPDGAVIGASNFGHRTAGGFDGEQWGGARGIANDLPEVGIWEPNDSSEEKARMFSQATAAVTSQISRLPSPQSPSVATPKYLYANIPVNRTGVFPANEAGSFVRDIGGELIAVKRPGYYAAVYVGRPAGHPLYIAGKEHFRQPLPDNAENTGGLAAFRKATPFTGGGLSLFQTRAYGNAILAGNWSPLVHNGLVAIRADGARYWEDYFATRYHLDPAAGILSVSGIIEDVPIHYVRTYRFNPRDVEVRIVLTADKAVALSRLFENIPIAEGEVKTRGVVISTGGQAAAEVSSSLVQVHDKTGVGIDIRLNGAPRSLHIQPNGLRVNKLQIGRVEIELPAAMKAGQTVELTYRIIPTGDAT